MQQHCVEISEAVYATAPSTLASYADRERWMGDRWVYRSRSLAHGSVHESPTRRTPRMHAGTRLRPATWRWTKCRSCANGWSAVGSWTTSSVHILKVHSTLPFCRKGTGPLNVSEFCARCLLAGAQAADRCLGRCICRALHRATGDIHLLLFLLS